MLRLNSTPPSPVSPTPLAPPVALSPRCCSRRTDCDAASRASHLGLLLHASSPLYFSSLLLALHELRRRFPCLTSRVVVACLIAPLFPLAAARAARTMSPLPMPPISLTRALRCRLLLCASSSVSHRFLYRPPLSSSSLISLDLISTDLLSIPLLSYP